MKPKFPINISVRASTLLFFIILVSSSSFLTCTSKYEFPPNIIFILADDMGHGDLKAFNPESKIHTPSLDQLADNGIIFTDAHTPAAWCIPSRYGILTGKYLFNNTRNYQESLIDENQMTLATILKEANYTNYMVGKWHQGLVNEKNPNPDNQLDGGPVDHGFDYYFGIPASLDIPPYYYIENKSATSLLSDTTLGMEGTAPNPNSRKIQGPFYRPGKMAEGFDHSTVVETFQVKANQLISGHFEEGDNPFFLYLALPSPHTPWLPPQEHVGKSGVGDYGDYVLQVDDVVASLVNSLKKEGKFENTLIIFASDNGPVWYQEDVDKYGHRSTGIYSGMKGDAWEGGHRMPLIVHWPDRIKEGRENDGLVCFTDFVPTFADLVDFDLDKNTIRGFSLLPTLIDHTVVHERDHFIMISTGRKYSSRIGDWKYIEGKGAGGFTEGYDRTHIEGNPHEGQLYNLSSDPGEKKNLYDQYPEKIKELKKLIADNIELKTNE